MSRYLGQACEGEHANLLQNEGPVARGTLVNKCLVQLLAHGDDAIGHSLQLHLPLLIQLGVAQYGGHNGSSMAWRVAVHRPDHLYSVASCLVNIVHYMRNET